MNYLDYKFDECVKKTAYKIKELSEKYKRGTLTVGCGTIYVEDDDFGLYSCFYLDRAEIYGTRGNVYKSTDKIAGYNIFNYDVEWESIHTTCFRFYEGFVCLFKLGTAKKFVKALKEEMAKIAHVSLSFWPTGYQTLMKINYEKIADL